MKSFEGWNSGFLSLVFKDQVFIWWSWEDENRTDMRLKNDENGGKNIFLDVNKENIVLSPSYFNNLIGIQIYFWSVEWYHCSWESNPGPHNDNHVSSTTELLQQLNNRRNISFQTNSSQETSPKLQVPVVTIHRSSSSEKVLEKYPQKSETFLLKFPQGPQYK